MNRSIFTTQSGAEYCDFSIAINYLARQNRAHALCVDAFIAGRSLPLGVGIKETALKDIRAQPFF